MPLGDYSYLANGMTGAGVQEMQTDLANLGFSLSVDGVYGPGTYQAVRNFQYSWTALGMGNLTIDGVVGPQTASAIKQAVDLLYQGQWYQEDAQNAPQAANVPIPGITPPVIGATAQTQPGASTGAGLPSLSSLSSLLPSSLAGLDWKWVGIGAVAVVGFFYFMQRRR